MLPIRPVVLPLLLNGAQNGRLADAILEEVQPGMRLMRDAARSWRHMSDAATAAGHPLRINNSYRTYDEQVELFVARYTTAYDPAGEHATWNGLTYTKKTGQATAAVPGNSNHGFGLAVDLQTDGDFYSGTFDWLLSCAVLWGWSAELQTEPWHWHYFAGDWTEPAAQPIEPELLEVDMIRLVVTDDPAGAQLVLGAGTVCWIASGTLPPIYDFAKVPSANVTVAQVHDILLTHDKIGQAPNQGALLGAW